MLKKFPRGGEKHILQKSSNALFNSKHICRKRTTQAKKRDDNVRVKEINLIATTAERLSNATLCEGMIVLGRISEATEYELIVSIPGGLLGRIQVTDLSESYTDLLQSIIDSKSIQDEFKSLPDLYSPGDYVVCYIKNIDPEGKWVYSLSLEPQLINQNIDSNYLANGVKVVCTIKSIEDHGYIVDTGIPNVRAFIDTKNVEKGKQYFPGNQISCVIKEVKTIDRTSVIMLSAKKRNVDNVSVHNIECLDVLVPGTKLPLCVTRVLSNGLQVTFGKDNIGYINQIYLDNPLSMYANNTEVTGTLLYVMPTVKLAYFSLLTDISEKERLNVGDIIKKAKVLYRESNGMIFQLSKTGLRGFISLRRTNIPFIRIPTELKQGSVHKCRILAYNWIEHIYVCTMENEILEQKYFSPSDLNLGDTLTVRVTSIDPQSGFVKVQAGKIHGFVAPEHISDNGLSALNHLKVGDNINARVLDINNDNHNIRFTLKQSLMKSILPVLHDIHEAQCGSKHHGTITKINKNGLLVRFYGDVKGWVPCTVLGSDTSDINWNYSIGQTVTVCIDSLEVDEGKMKLKIVTKERKRQPTNYSIGQLVEGTVIESSMKGIYLRICKIEDEDVATGFLPAGHMSPCIEVGSLLASKYVPGDIISAFVFATQPSIILSRTFVTEKQYRNFDSLKIGDCIPCTIRDISQDGLRVILPIENYFTFGFVPYKNVSNFELLCANQMLFVKITAINRREKQLTLTMALKDVWESSLEHRFKMMTAVDALSLYLNKLSELATSTFYKERPISSVTLGQKVVGSVKNITEHGLVLQLDNNLTGTVRKCHYSGNFKIGDKISGTILWKNHVHNIVDVSLLPIIINSISSKQKALPHLPAAIVLRGKILMITNWFILVLIKRHGLGYLAVLPVRRHVNDVSPDLRPYVIHAKIRLYIVLNASESDILPICMLKSAFETPRNKTETAISTTNKQLKREKTSVQCNIACMKSTCKPSDNDCNAVNREESVRNKTSNINHKNGTIGTKKDTSGKKLNEVRMELECFKQEQRNTGKNNGIVEEKGNTIRDVNDVYNNTETDEDSSGEGDVKTPLEKLGILQCGFYWDNKPSLTSANLETSSDDEGECTEEPKRKKKKFNAAERREEERQKEREIRQREEALASKQVPNSIDQFDRLVLSSPDSSLVWLQYMAYHLQATEIDKARAIARRAIKTINFREENERLNVWNAWLNLESRFGTPESLNDVFQEAVKANDALKIYTHMLTVHADANRRDELEKLIRTITGKFKQNPQIWIDSGSALLKIGLKEKSRYIMQRALQSLPASQHIYLIVRFANVENKLGDKERSQTLFEQILSSYPKRVDVWSSYVDSLIKSGDIDIARRVLERAVVQILPARKMKTLFQKFIHFEEKYGTPEAVEQINQMVADYVEKQCNKE